LLPLEQPSPRLLIALIHVALGYLYTKGHRYQHIMMELGERTPLGKEVTRVLEEHVGVSTAQARAIIEQFLDDYAWQKRF
jgi:hypothetical protein